MKGPLLLFGLVTIGLLPSDLGCTEPAIEQVVEGRAYNALLDSKKCKASSAQGITCTYSIGDELDFSIEGIGEFDVAVSFNYVSADSLYYARFASRPGCVFIQRKLRKSVDLSQAMSDLAYVSPRNGKVYRDWRECKDAQ
jgi:hypothetical protein